MNKTEIYHNPGTTKENKEIKIGSLADFDMEFFKSLEGENGWIALGDEYYKNARYFTILGENGEKMGIVGVFDTDEEQNVSHTVIDPQYRGKKIAGKAKEILMERLDLPFMTLTIDLDNISSIRAAEKLPEVEKISDEKYEQEFHKVKYRYNRRK